MTVKAIDPYPQWTADQTGGYAFNGFAITPSDTDELATVINRVYVGVAGDISVILAGDTTAVVLKSAPVGMLTGLRIRQVKSTGTAATNLIGFY